ncbi:unnamed protein product, partial [Prorocentrum cordatum]
PLPRPLSASASAPAGWGREGAWAVCTARRRRGREETRSKTTKSEAIRPCRLRMGRGKEWTQAPPTARQKSRRSVFRHSGPVEARFRAWGPPEQEQRREGPAASLRHHGALTRQASIRCRGPRRRTLRHRAWHVEAWQDAKASLASRTAATQNAGLAWRRNLPHAARNTGHKQTSAAGTPARAGSDTCHERARIGEDVHSASSTSTRAGPRAILTNARVQPQKEGEGRRGGCRVSPRRRELAARGTSWPSAVWRPAGSPLGHRREGEEEEEEDPREERGERREVSLRRASTRRVQGESPPRASSRRAGHPGPAQCGGPQAARSGIDGGRREEEERREERGGAGRERRNEEGKKACEASLRRVSTRRVQGESPPQASSRPKGNPAPRAVQRPAGSPLGHRRKEEEEKEEG